MAEHCLEGEITLEVERVALIGGQVACYVAATCISRPDMTVFAVLNRPVRHTGRKAWTDAVLVIEDARRTHIVLVRQDPTVRPVLVAQV